MNSPPSGTALALALPHGSVRWAPGERVSIRTLAGHEARAGDGVGADLVGLLAGAALPEAARVTVDAPLPPVTGTERGFGAEVDMTNWNLIVDDAVIVKVVGRLGDGDRAVRLGRAIARHVPDALPRLHGTIELDTDHGARVVATVHEYLDGSSDGWTWAVDDALHALGAGTRSRWPAALGDLIARVHRALHQETAAHSAAMTRSDDDALIDDAELLDTVEGAASRRLRARWASITAAISRTPAAHSPRFAIHGDLHVGQVLRDRSGALRLIDFDGDPQGGLDPDSADAAIDVAHLLVSIDLVGAIVAKRWGADDSRIIDWCDASRADLLAAYRARDRDSPAAALLDESRLPGLEAQQLLREVRYAQRFLPRWSYASDWAITRRFAPDTDLEDPPWTPPDSSTT